MRGRVTVALVVVALGGALACKSDPVVYLTEGGPDAPTTPAAKLPALQGNSEYGPSSQRGGTEDVTKFDSFGTYKTLSGAVYVTAFQTTTSNDHASLEVSVESGTVRGYLANGNSAFIHMSTDQGGYRYVEATPGHPKKMSGELVYMKAYGCVLESVNGEATGVKYHMWR